MPAATKTQNKSGEGGGIDNLTVDAGEIEQRVAAGESRATLPRRIRLCDAENASASPERCRRE
jgi:hypothetical protein